MGTGHPGLRAHGGMDLPKAMLAYAELILLAFLDPTGLLTLLGAMGFQNTAELFLAAHSRKTSSRPTRRG